MESKFSLKKAVTSGKRKPLKSKIKKSNPNELGILIMHKGLWALVFSFIGLNHELMKLRIVSKKWKKNIEYSLDFMIKNRKSIMEGQLEDIYSIDSKLKIELENALEKRQNYEKYLDLIPQKWSLFVRVSDLAKLQRPPAVLHESITSVLNLFVNQEEYQKLKGIDWKYCQDVLKRKDFMSIMAKITPNTLDEDRVGRFEYFIGRSLITPDYVHRESTQAAYMLEWAISLVDSYKSEKNLPPEVTERVQLLASIRKEQAFIEYFSKIHKKVEKKKLKVKKPDS